MSEKKKRPCVIQRRQTTVDAIENGPVECWVDVKVCDDGKTSTALKELKDVIEKGDVMRIVSIREDNNGEGITAEVETITKKKLNI